MTLSRAEATSLVCPQLVMPDKSTACNQKAPGCPERERVQVEVVGWVGRDPTMGRGYARPVPLELLAMTVKRNPAVLRTADALS